MSASSHQAEPQMNATPLIDVLLVLLVMIVLVVPMATQTAKLNLPQPVNGTPPPEIRVDVVADGAIYWNGERMPSVEATYPHLSALAARTDPPVLRVVPERRAPYEPVAQLLTAAQRAHVERISVTSVPD